MTAERLRRKRNRADRRMSGCESSRIFICLADDKYGILYGEEGLKPSGVILIIYDRRCGMFFDWVTFGEPLTFWQMVLRIVAAVVFGAIIGVEREMKNRPAGMRTHVLVCLGAALIGLVEQQTIAHVVALGSPHINVSVGRLTAQIVSGVGFLGAGTIIIADRRISGLPTAASLWCAACLGLAVGAGFTTMAMIACLVVMVVLKLMQRIVHVNTYKRLEVQYIHRNDTLKYIRDIFEKMEVKVLDQDFHAETMEDGQSIYTNVYSLSMRGKANYQDLITILSEYPNIRTVRTRNV